MQLWQQLINTLILSAVNEALPSSRCPQWQLRVRVLHPIQAQRISLALLIAELQQPLGALPSFFQPSQTPATKAKEEQTLPEPEQAGEGQGSDLCRENLRKNRETETCLAELGRASWCQWKVPGAPGLAQPSQGCRDGAGLPQHGAQEEQTLRPCREAQALPSQAGLCHWALPLPDRTPLCCSPILWAPFVPFL